MLEIVDLKAQVEDKEVLHGINLTVKPGQVHAIMGPNGSGKSSLSKIIAGHPSYKVTGGDVFFDINLKRQSILQMAPDERAREGLFLAFQYPVEVPGVTNFTFLHTAFNLVVKHHGAEEMSSADFRKFVLQKMKIVQMREDFLDRPVNVGFSGGEKKRNEILQMAVLSPRVSFLDETDSGLDIDSLKIVSDGINKLRSAKNATVLITHYQRLLDFVKPDFVHVLVKGKIVASGGPELALELEKRGYEEWIQ